MASHNVARTTRAPRTDAQRTAELDKIASYRALETRLLDLNASSSTSPSPFSDPATFDLTTDLLLRNPEHYTAWNARKRCLTCGSLSKPSPGPSPSAPPPKSSAPSTASPSSAEWSAPSSAAIPPPPASPAPATSGQSGTTHDQAQAQGEALDTLRSELMFTLPLIKAYPKCYWIWHHRLWLLRQAIVLLPRPAARRVWEEELGLVAMMLNKDQRNFLAWGYRRHVVSTLEGPSLAATSMAETELAYTEQKVSSGLSNFSAWHHRTKIIPRILAERGADDAARLAFLEGEFAVVRRALDVGPEDQSCWYYHQYLVANMTDPPSAATIAPNLDTARKLEMLRSEVDNIRELLEDYDEEDIKLAYEALIDYTLVASRLQDREATPAETDDLRGWLGRLRALDPMRKGRWDDFEREHRLA
ncbi:geranylgeranyl transferase type-2 subunit alpha [Plectosphaerella plurivora]|uniref:Geranylgeranyl transferase type-2 subunit alpha n=1 Tax=Plectosphaerella plurivora TaxID=936078 RepID=A0A9P9AB50_9PEZI|nr:geranylgeranyl transferase type-2 subunit alpha [Plectosphaerella plurivora]